MSDAATIAASLTKAQREALVNAAYGGFGRPAGSLYHVGKSATGRKLLALGLVTITGRLNASGLAVRALLATLKDTDHG